MYTIHKKRLCEDCGCGQTLPEHLQSCECACHPQDRESGPLVNSAGAAVQQ